MPKKPLYFSPRKLLKCRKRAKLSRFKLSEAIGFVVGPSTIGRYEKGETIPSINTFLRIVGALKVQPVELFDAKS
jgi:transcriptional regulator with XRE-family HTH domain